MAAVVYMDYVNGLDTNDGTSWATALKTLNGCTTFKGVASGTEIRVAKSPDPTSLGQSATWTNLGKTVTLTTPVTANIDLGEATWTAANGATCSFQTGTFKAGTGAPQIVLPTTTVANTLYAYKALGSAIDFSAYAAISFWLRDTAAIINANNFRLCLCSDAAGATIVNSVPFPVIPGTNILLPVTVDLGSALGSSIQSVALYSGSATVSVSHSIILDNILACKASSAPDSLSLLSLISKNSGTVSSEGWFPIQSINGTAVLLDNYITTTVANARGYAGITETVLTYKRETTRTALVTAAGTVVQQAAVGNISINGGYNTADLSDAGLQDGETYFDGQCGMGSGINALAGTQGANTTKISMVRYSTGYNITSGNSTFVSGHDVIACSTGVALGAPNNGCNITNANNNLTGIGFSGTATSYCRVNFVNCNNNFSVGITLGGAHKALIQGSTMRNNGTGSVTVTAITTDCIISGVTMDNMTDTANYILSLYCRNCTFGTTPWTGGTGNSDERLYCQNYNNVVGDHRIFTDVASIVTDKTIVHTAGGTSWKIAPTSSARSALYPVWLVLGKVFCPANETRTFSAWFRRSNTGITGQLVIRGGKINGIPNTVTDTMTAAANTWEQRSLTVTPTEDGVIEVEAWGYGGTSYNVWVTEFSVT